MGRDSRMVCLSVSVSPGYTGVSQLTFSSPGEPRLLDSCRKPRTISPIAIAQVCQPLALSLPNMDLAAAASSRWKG